MKTMYVYDGPVKVFGEQVTNSWTAETWAESESKAMSNFKYQYKQKTNRSRDTKIELPGNIIAVS